jgi:SAM-dependent methyltransferase
VGHPPQRLNRSWFAVDGTLEPIEFDGPSYFRFPEAVAEYAISRYSRAGDWVLDPFCGFGTTLVVAQRLGRHGGGFEVDVTRAAFAASRVVPPSVVVPRRGDEVGEGPWPPFRLLFTSPPYGSFRSGEYDDDMATYVDDARRLFSGFKRFLAPGATVVVEVSQVRQGAATRPLVWHLGLVLAELFPFREDVVRVNTGPDEAGPGYGHSHLLVFDSP